MNEARTHNDLLPCRICGKDITREEYVVHWASCALCFDRNYEAYLKGLHTVQTESD